MSLHVCGLFDEDSCPKNVYFKGFDPVNVYTISCTPEGIVVVYEDGLNIVYGSDSLQEKVNLVDKSSRIEMFISYYSYSLVLLNNGKLGFFDKDQNTWEYTKKSIFRHISGIESYACAIDSKGKVRVIKNNKITRKIKLPQPAVSVVPTNLGSIFILTKDGFVYNVIGSKDPVKNHELELSVITKLVGNSSHVMAIEEVQGYLKSTKLYSLGHNTHGQLATLEGRRYSTNKFVKAFYLDKIGDVQDISCGLDFSIARYKNGMIVGVGQNDDHQISQKIHPHIFSEPLEIDRNVTWYCASDTYTAWTKGFNIINEHKQFGEVDPSLHIIEEKSEIPMILPVPTKKYHSTISHHIETDILDNNVKNQIEELKKEQERLQQLVKQQEIELRIWKPFSEDGIPKGGKENPFMEISKLQKKICEVKQEHARQIGIQQEIFSAQESPKILALEYQNKILKKENEELKTKLTQDQIDRTGKLLKVPSIESETRKLLSDHQNMLNELKQLRMNHQDTVAEFNKQLKLKILQIEKLIYGKGRNQSLDDFEDELSDYDLLMLEKDKITKNIIDDRNNIREELLQEQNENEKLRSEIEVLKSENNDLKKDHKNYTNIIQDLKSNNENLTLKSKEIKLDTINAKKKLRIIKNKYYGLLNRLKDPSQ